MPTPLGRFRLRGLPAAGLSRYTVAEQLFAGAIKSFCRKGFIEYSARHCRWPVPAAPSNAMKIGNNIDCVVVLSARASRPAINAR